jgi:hypothetical protein
MLPREVVKACVIAALAAGCGGKVYVDGPGSGGAGGTGGGPADAGVDAPPGACSVDADCPSPGPCSAGACVAGTCAGQTAPDGTPCDDGLFCTEGDACFAGHCVSGGPKACPSIGECLSGICDEAAKGCGGVPKPEGTPCNDDDICSVKSACLGGICTTTEPLDCSILDGLCVIGVCDFDAGCVTAPAPDGTPCDDGTVCTTGEACKGGVCGGGTGPVVYFADDFSDDSKGWILGPEWQIGPAKASPPGGFGADPPIDHSPSADNGVAGVAIGGNASTFPHPFAYLESPPFSTLGGPGPVIFQYHRWLNSDYDPFMHNRVEVWDGAQWVILWQSSNQMILQDSPPIGAGWTYVQFDISSFKSASTRVRFGFDVVGGAFPVGSWNLDDVLVANASCP